MDNVTHAIAGVVTAELFIHARRARRGATDEASPAWPRAAWAVSILAQNMPDADGIYTRITKGIFGYLLHHRGHTHTVALAPVMAAVSYALVMGWARARRHPLSPGDRRWLAVLAFVGPFGHMALDACNDYGIHPFWPIDSGWHYGDTIFIVEPLMWAVTLPMIIAATSARAGRMVWSLLLALGVAAPCVVGWVPWPSALGTTLVAAAMIAVTARSSPAPRAVFAFVASLALVALFGTASAVAASSLKSALARAHPEWETVDVARSPIPATPLCWRAIAIQRSRDGARYALRSASVSAWPSLATASACDRSPRGTTAPLARTPAAVREASVVVTGELEAPLSELRDSARRCDVAAYLRWSRAPFLAHERDGSVVLGDLRYDRSPAIEFAETRAPADVVECPRWVPSWDPPRAEWLTGAGASQSRVLQDPSEGVKADVGKRAVWP